MKAYIKEKIKLAVKSGFLLGHRAYSTQNIWKFWWIQFSLLSNIGIACESTTLSSVSMHEASSRSLLISSSTPHWVPTPQHIAAIEKSISQWLSNHWGMDKQDFCRNYRTQYSGITKNKSRVVLFNSHCRDLNIDNWEKDLVQIIDGGYCIFHGIYDVRYKEILYLTPNLPSRSIHYRADSFYILPHKMQIHLE